MCTARLLVKKPTSVGFFYSEAKLIVYLGISTVMSWSLTFAWQDSLDVGSNPHALSNISSSSSSDSSSDEKPSLITTWQVVQAQTWSQACSISIWFFNKTLHIDSPA